MKPESDGGTLRLIPFETSSPAMNMALDEILLVEGHCLTMRLYGWSPIGLSLGRFQGTVPPEILAALGDRAFEIVRRETGGGAIVHARELTYSLSGNESSPPFDGPIDRSYRFVHERIIEVLHELGVEAAFAAEAPKALSHRERPFLCFDRKTSADLAVHGRKIAGSAKRRRAGRALQHGSIILAPHPAQLGAISVQEASGSAPDPAALGSALAARLAAALGLAVWACPFSATERAAAAAALDRGKAPEAGGDVAG